MQSFKQYIFESRERERRISTWWNPLSWNYKNTWKKVILELQESKDAAQILARAASGENITDIERKFVHEQVKDIMKGVVFGSVVISPGSIILVPTLLWIAKRLGIDLRPSSFKQESSKQKIIHHPS